MLVKPGIDYIGVGVGAMIVKDGEVLLLKRSANAQNERGCWENPGGAVEWGEKFEEAIKRELKEELGVEIKILGKLPIQECFMQKDKQHWISQTFVADIKDDDRPKIMEPEKHDDISWFAINSLPKPLSAISLNDFKNYLCSFQEKTKY